MSDSPTNGTSTPTGFAPVSAPITETAGAPRTDRTRLEEAVAEVNAIAPDAPLRVVSTPAAPVKPRLLSRDAILAADDLKFRVVHVPEWRTADGVEHVKVRGLTAQERDRLEQSMIVGKGKHRTTSVADFRAKVCALGIVDDEGNALFSLDDMGLLGRKSAQAMTRCAEAISELSGLTDADMEEIVGNSASATSAGSSSA